MATRPAASRLFVLLVLHFLIFIQFGSAAETQLITAEPGKDAILPCEAPEKKPVVIVEWSRPGENDHVALYQDDQFDNEGQNSSYKNRVDLQDREMKNGDVSLVLKNVMIADTGTYECRVDGIKSRRRKRSQLDTDPICIITLGVSAPGNKDEQNDGGSSTGLIAGLSVPVVLVLLAVSGFLLYKKRRSSQKQN